MNIINNKIKIAIIVLILLIIFLQNNINIQKKNNFGLIDLNLPSLPDYTDLNIDYVQNRIKNYSYNMNVTTIPDNYNPVNSNLYRIIYKQNPAPGTKLTAGMNISFWYYNKLDVFSTKIIDSLSGNNDNINFFNITKKVNSNIISLNKISNVAQTLINNIYSATFYLSLVDPGYVMLYNRDTRVYYFISSIYTQYNGIKYDNVFMFIKSTGEIQVVGIINSSKTQHILWKDVRFVRKTLNKNHPFYLKIENNGNINGYFYDYTNPSNIVNFLDYNNFINKTLTSQPNLDLIQNKGLYNIVNVLSGQFYTNQLFLGSRLILSNGSCSLILNTKGDLIFSDSSNNNNKLILSSNKPLDYDSRFVFILTDVEFSLRIYEVDRADNILNNNIPTAEINLLYKNFKFQDIDPTNINPSNPLTVPLSYIINKPYTLIILQNKLFFTFVEKGTKNQRILPLSDFI